jgi:hypothetical protein
MARYMGGALSAGAGSTTLPLMSLYAIASNGCALREVGVFNTTATGVAVKMARFSTAGTQGSSITIAKYNTNRTAQMTMFQTHAVAPTTTDAGYRAQLGAAVGAGVIWTFGDSGIIIEPGTANGLGVVIENGTGQVCQVYFVWDE